MEISYEKGDILVLDYQGHVKKKTLKSLIHFENKVLRKG